MPRVMKSYDNGWFYFDGTPLRRPELVAEADEMMRSYSHYVRYYWTWNTFMLGEIGPED
jgi:hypothetical protein